MDYKQRTRLLVFIEQEFHVGDQQGARDPVMSVTQAPIKVLRVFLGRQTLKCIVGLSVQNGLWLVASNKAAPHFSGKRLSKYR